MHLVGYLYEHAYFFAIVIDNVHITFHTFVLAAIGAVTTIDDNTGIHVKAEPNPTTV